MALSRELKVGIFVFLGLVVAGLIIFLIGDNKMLFSKKVDFVAQFTDVQGLKPGSTVRMGGVDIGNVSHVSYPEDTGELHIDVGLSIVEREARRIRVDSEASIGAKGLLGDKLVTISPGGADKPVAEPGTVLRSSGGDDIGQLVGRVQKMSEKAESALSNLEAATRVFAEPQLHEDIRGGASALRNILDSLDTGKGFAARVLHDEEDGERFSRLIANLERTTSELDATLGSVRVVLDRVNSGPGLAHELVYGESSARAVAQFGAAADELTATLQGVRNGKGIVRDLLFGAEGETDQRVANNLAALTDDLRVVMSDMRQGKGTLGALLVDPSVYEDLKVLLGNVQRNQALRALVRYSIKKDGSPATVEVTDPEPGRDRGVSGSAARE
jgi:phospholipid/cholesterol/gamma-HCH transport system substrate-binding protein